MTIDEVRYYAHYFCGSEVRYAPRFFTFQVYKIIIENSAYGIQYKKEEDKKARKETVLDHA